MLNKALFLSIALCLFTISMVAQIDFGLVAHYSFDGCTPDDALGNPANQGLANGNPACDCGVIENALRLDGVDDNILFAGPVNNQFTTTDFSISFYFKSTSPFGTQDIISKRVDCSNDNVFAIRYTPSSNFINVIMSQNSGKSASLSAQLNFDNCWQHIVVVRDGVTTLLYVNGELTETSKALSRVDIANNAFLSLGNSPCQETSMGSFEVPFSGFIDELRVYDRAIKANDVKDLYVKPDLIGNKQDTLIFLGGAVDAFIPNTCADDFQWTPEEYVSDVTSANPIIQPTEEGTYVYTVDVGDATCVATDSISITVVDPATLDCAEVFLPNVFTPNGDGRNDSFGLSNPFAVEKVLSFEIFDRWGSRLFYTDDALGRWDGTFKGESVNPGVLLYKVIYTCKGEEQIKAGSVSILR